MRFGVSFLLLFFICSNVFSQSKFSITGQFVDENDEPVPFATITLSNDSLAKNAVTRFVADENGNFSTTIGQSGRYFIISEFIGKRTFLKSISVTEKETKLGKLVMEPASELLNEVTVTIQKPLVKIDLDKIIYSMEDDPESQTSNALDMLRKVPLVTVDGEDKVQVKGSGSYKILVNGKPSTLFNNNPEKVLKSMPASGIKNVEVITEPGAKYDSEGVSAIINLVTEKNTTDGFTGSVGADVNTSGGYNADLYLALKYGKLGVTLNGSYYKWLMPEAGSSNVTKYLQTQPNQILNQKGTRKFNQDGIWGSGLVSYEIDTLRLLSLSIGNHTGNGSNNSAMYTEFGTENTTDYFYKRFTENNFNYGGTELSLDYQRSFAKKGELLTLSYKYGMSPNDSDGNSYTEMISGNAPERDLKPFKTKNNARSNEHTGQIDYVNPLNDKHTIETGLKFIHRNNNSEGFYSSQMPDGTWKDSIEFHNNNQLSHTQNVFSGYGSYQFKTMKYGIKAGVRFESTDQNIYFGNYGKIPNKPYFNVIPSALFTYQLGMTKNLKFGYNMQVSRPGIWYLNPFENKIDPNNISRGNPNLKPEKSHEFSLSFGSFSPKFMINSGIYYSYSNEAITNVTEVIENSRILTTYKNIGRNERIGGNVYFNWSPNTKLRLSSNLLLNYVNVKNTESSEVYDGVESYLYVGGSYNLPAKIKLNGYFGLYQFGVGFQSSKPSTGYYHGLSLTREFFKDKLTVKVYAREPFWKRQTMKMIRESAYFYNENRYEQIRQSVGIGISFRFGELKSQIKKVERGISNTDIVTGGQGQGESTQGR